MVALSGLNRRPRRWHRTIAIGTTAVALLSTAACTSSGSLSSGSKIGDTLALGVPASPASLNPAIGDPAFSGLYQWAYEPLVILDGDGTYRAGLAEKWGYVGEGNTSYELTLRSGAKFSDGTAVDAQAVKTYLDYERAQKTGSLAALLANVSSIEATDAQTVRITLSKADPGLTYYFAQGFGVGNIASSKAVADPTSLDTSSAGAGPYKIDASQSVAGDHYTYVPNTYYYDKSKQHWKTVTIRVIANPSSMVQAMQAGQIQAAVGDATTLQAAKNAKLTVIAPPQALTGLNLMDRNGTLVKALGDVRVRQALNLAVDRTAIATALYGDKNLALTQYALDGQQAYDASLNDAYPHDVAKAKQLLSEAGYGSGFTLNVLSSPLNGFDKMIQAVGGQLADVGVTLNVTSKATATDYITELIGGKYPAAAIGYGLGDMNTLYAGFVNPAGPFNPLHIDDPALDALYAKYNVADADSGKALQQQINAYLVKQAWTVPVVGAPLAFYLSDGLTGLDATTANSGVPYFADLHASS